MIPSRSSNVSNVKQLLPFTAWEFLRITSYNVCYTKLLREGAPEEFVLGKYRIHVWACGDLGVTPMPFIPYMAELLEVFLLDAKAAGAARMHDQRPDGTAEAATSTDRILIFYGQDPVP